MGSGAGAVEETVDTLVAAGEKVGMLQVRLFQPFPSAQLIAALPPTVRSIAVLDRTKEPGAVGEPLYQARGHAPRRGAWTSDAPPFAAEPRVDRRPLRPVLEGVHAVDGQAGLRRARARRARSGTSPSGIYDDVTHLSLPIDAEFRRPRPAGEVQAVFFGLGSDGTVGANKASVKIIGEGTDLYAQGYFVYDSKKSGRPPSRTCASGRSRSASTYLIDARRLRRLPPVRAAREGEGARVRQARAPRSSSTRRTARTRSGTTCRAGCSSCSSRRQIDFWVIDALRRRRRGRHGQPHQHGDAALLLPARRRPPGRRGDPPDQGVRREDVREARRRPSSTATSPPSTARSQRLGRGARRVAITAHEPPTPPCPPTPPTS